MSAATGTPIVTSEPSGSWQPVPGTAAGQFLILERKSDPFSSHAALVRLPDAVLIIDTGSSPDLAAPLSRLAGAASGQAHLPVLLVLTHLHWDHLAVLPLLSFPAHVPVMVLAQESAVAALARGDRQASAAFLFGSDCPVVEVTLPLLPATARTAATTWQDDRAPGLVLRLVPDQVLLPAGGSVPCERIQIGGHDLARVFHTPGHTTDSICLQVGGLLWVGDLFLAANPAVAGIPGWDCEALLASLTTVAELLDALPLSLCCPGHGRPLPAAKARQVIADVRSQAAALRDVATLDPQRVSLLVEYSEDLLSEGLALFTIMAGRLYTVSFHLEALEESATASAVLQMLDVDSIDASLDDLRSFAEGFRRQHRLELALPLKGVQTVARIEKLFDSARLRGLLDPVLLRRARHLLDDFTHSVRGIEAPSVRQPEALLPILADLAQSFAPPAPSADSLWDASGDEQAFRQALTQRLAAAAAGVVLAVDVELAPTFPLVALDRERFVNTLHAVLSEFVGAGAGGVRITGQGTASGGRLELHPVPDRVCPCFTPRKLRFLDRDMRLGGGTLADVSTPATTVLALGFEAATSSGLPAAARPAADSDLPEGA
jgi:glyoxylase-like metal-dependent hydrolase (beta-lactamase superfamily II)